MDSLEDQLQQLHHIPTGPALSSQSDSDKSLLTGFAYRSLQDRHEWTYIPPIELSPTEATEFFDQHSISVTQVDIVQNCFPLSPLIPPYAPIVFHASLLEKHVSAQIEEILSSPKPFQAATSTILLLHRHRERLLLISSPLLHEINLKRPLQFKPSALIICTSSASSLKLAAEISPICLTVDCHVVAIDQRRHFSAEVKPIVDPHVKSDINLFDVKYIVIHDFTSIKTLYYKNKFGEHAKIHHELPQGVTLNAVDRITRSIIEPIKESKKHDALSYLSVIVVDDYSSVEESYNVLREFPIAAEGFISIACGKRLEKAVEFISVESVFNARDDKIAKLMDLLDSWIASENKILITCEELAAVDKVHRILHSKGFKVLKLSGKKARAQQHAVKSFQQDVKSQFLVSTTKLAVDLHVASEFCVVFDVPADTKDLVRIHNQFPKYRILFHKTGDVGKLKNLWKNYFVPKEGEVAVPDWLSAMKK
ncbi:hypothetical protein GEMRC1_008126 [Eukaryota sp. GEM-RC1]